jgi:hypothetical protein
MRPARLLFLLLAGVSAAIALHPRPPASAAPAPDGGANEQSKARWMGVATCSAAGCHHGNGPREQAGSEYSTWAAHDKHAKAFAVLENERSRQMIRNLYGDKTTKLATTDELCLKCHAMYGGEDDLRGERFYQGDGVGCECCHGRAEHWLGEHYRNDFLRLLGPEKEQRYGLRDLKDLAVRARTCAGCHVGGPDKEVNHDLIAAGHPRLNFEFSAFLALYPRHWTRESELRRHADFEARAWAVGQVASAEAAVKLLEARAANPKKPWPEFAEYACYACHKDLSADLPAMKGRPPGSLPWATWYVAELEPLAGFDRVPLGQKNALLRVLQEQMQAGSPDRAKVARQAAELAGVLHTWSVRLSDPAAPARSPAGVRDLARALAADGAKRATEGMDWDQATQVFLALAALNQGLADLQGASTPPPLLGELKGLHALLRGSFELGFDSPRLFPRNARPFLADRLKAISDRMGNKPGE